MDAIVSRFSQPSRPGPPFSGEALAPPRRVWWFPQELDYPLAMFPRRTMDLLIADRAARAAVAVALYRAGHGGQLPRTLEELRPAYLTDVPQDPATGGPLLYRSDDRSYTVYSTGPDRKDDGGDLVSDLRAVEQRGWGRRLVHGKDVGVRVLLNAANKEASSPAGSSR